MSFTFKDKQLLRKVIHEEISKQFTDAKIDIRNHINLIHLEIIKVKKQLDKLNHSSA